MAHCSYCGKRKCKYNCTKRARRSGKKAKPRNYEGETQTPNAIFKVSARDSSFIKQTSDVILFFFPLFLWSKATGGYRRAAIAAAVFQS